MKLQTGAQNDAGFGAETRYMQTAFIRCYDEASKFVLSMKQTVCDVLSIVQDVHRLLCPPSGLSMLLMCPWSSCPFGVRRIHMLRLAPEAGFTIELANLCGKCHTYVHFAKINIFLA